MNELAAKIKRKAGKIFRSKVVKSDNPVRWGIIGLGYMGETFSTAIDGNRSGIVAAVGSRSLDKARRFARVHGNCKYYGSYDELIKDQTLDIIYVAVPVEAHFEIVKKCLESGQNVLCEKPVTSNAAQLRTLIDLSHSKNLFFMEGMWMKCLPVYRKASEWIKEGKIGKAQLVRCDFYKRRVSKSPDSYMGVLKDYGIYALSFPLIFGKGEPKVSGHSRFSQEGYDTDWQINMQFENDITAFVSISSDFGSISKAQVIGTDGSIEWESQFNRTDKIVLYDSLGRKIESFNPSYKFEGFEYEVDEVQKSLRDSRIESELVPLERSMTALEIMTSLLEARSI